MKTTFYEVSVQDSENGRGQAACPTLAAARKLRAGLEYPDGEVTKIVTVDLTIRELCCALVNGVGYAEELTTVLPALPEPSNEERWDEFVSMSVQDQADR